MQLKVKLRQVMLTVILFGFVLLVIPVFYFGLTRPIQSASTPLVKGVVASYEQIPEQTPVSFGLPVRLKVPKLNIDSAIDPVGLNTKGAMEIPEGPDDVAWFKLGQRPGEIGSAVIAGHYGIWKDGRKSVFDNLRKLSEGDKIDVENDQGMTVSFIVRKSRKYDPNANASDVFSSSDGIAHLNLITCSGTWDDESKSYSNRLVVFADKIDSAALTLRQTQDELDFQQAHSPDSELIDSEQEYPRVLGQEDSSQE